MGEAMFQKEQKIKKTLCYFFAWAFYLCHFFLFPKVQGLDWIFKTFCNLSASFLQQSEPRESLPLVDSYSTSHYACTSYLHRWWTVQLISIFRLVWRFETHHFRSLLSSKSSGFSAGQSGSIIQFNLWERSVLTKILEFWKVVRHKLFGLKNLVWLYPASSLLDIRLFSTYWNWDLW